MLTAPGEYLSAVQLVEHYKSGQADPVVIVETCLTKASYESAKGVFITLTPERARKEAAASRGRYRNGIPLSALDGVPIAWKDLFDIKGHTTTAGSAIYRFAPPAKKDAEIVANATRNGLITIGKTNLSEFAYSGLGINPHFGTPINPLSKAMRVPGGSSSGSALAVAMGIVPCAIGTDTSGSVRIPASFNGIVGFKASEERFSKQGVFPLSKTLDTIGIFANRVEDCIQLDSLLGNTTVYSNVPINVKDHTFVVPENIVFDDIEPTVLKNFNNTIDALEKEGATIVHKPIPVLTEILHLFAKHGTIVSAEAYQQHISILSGPQSLEIDPNIRNRLLLASNYTHEDYYRLKQLRQTFTEKISHSLDGGILTYPTVPYTAPLIEPLLKSHKTFTAMNTKILRNTMLTNYLGMPGIALPNGIDEKGLASSIMFSVPNEDDNFLLHLGEGIERIFYST